jgi:uncharacterized protein (TIGR03435 family)
MKRLTIGFVAALMPCAGGGWAQTAAPAPRFEVASVKSSVNSEGMRMRSLGPATTPGGVTMMGTSLKAAIQWAYHLQAAQVVGPGWLGGNRYDIVAKTSAPASDQQLREMMQSLLADRFQLAVHRETKEMEAYVVTIAKSGHKMKPSEGDGPMDAHPTGKGLNIAFTHVTLAQLAEMSESPLNGIVIDQTGLKGAWDFTIDGSAIMMQKPADQTEAIGLVISVLSDQLGIKIDQKKVPAEVMVVDHAEKIPVEN